MVRSYQVDNSHRTLHGALLDAELLADVYLAMTRGQESLIMEAEIPQPTLDAAMSPFNLQLTVLQASTEELEAHGQYLEQIESQSKGTCLWKRLESATTVG